MHSLKKFLKNLFMVDDYPENLPEEPVEDETIEPFVSFPCQCGKNVDIYSKVMPGEAVVTRCGNCDTSWTVYNPSLVINKTEEIPDSIQDTVWKGLST